MGSSLEILCLPGNAYICRGTVSLHLLCHLDELPSKIEAAKVLGGLVCAHSLVSLHKDYFLARLCSDLAGFVRPRLGCT